MLSPALPVTGRSRSRRTRRVLTAAGLSALVVLTACNSSKKATPAATDKSSSSSSAAATDKSSSASTPDSSSSSTPAESPSSSAESSSAATGGEKVTVNWFIGLGTGADPGQKEKEQAVADAFNASQNEVTLKLTVVQNVNAQKQLAQEIAGGKSPDLVGPVGIKGSNQFEGQWLDLAPLIASQKFDTSVYSAESMKSQTSIDGKQVAVPFAVFPSMLWYNKDLFDEAKIPYPPAKFGDQYEGKEWTWQALRELAKKMTLDKAGKDATDPAFDPNTVVQWGYHPQFGDSIQHVGAMYGAGSFGADDKKTAQIPEPWLAAWKDRHDMIWKDHTVPSAKQFNSDTLNKGNAFQTGKIAMASTHLWYQCCVKDSKGKALTFWDLAALPSYNGKITAPLHSDSFRILKSSKNPEAAFKVLAYFMSGAGNAPLLDIYGAMPAVQANQDAFFKKLDETWTQHPNWDVVKQALAYADVPNHESWTPAFLKTDERSGVFQTKLNTDPNMDVEAEAKTMQADMQKLFDAAGGK